MIYMARYHKIIYMAYTKNLLKDTVSSGFTKFCRRN